MLTLSKGRSVSVWDVQAGNELHRFEVLHSVWHRPFPDVLCPVAFSPDGRTILGVRRIRARGYVQLWDAETGRELQRTGTHDGFIYTAVFSPDGKRIITASYDRTARIWDVETGRQIQRLVGHRDRVQCAVFSSDGQRAFTASNDGTARAWDAETGKELRRYNHQGPVEYALPAGGDRRVFVRWTRMLAPWETPGHSSQEDWASVWDAETGREIQQIRHGRFTISPDGKRVLMAAESTTLQEAATGEVIRRYDPPPTPPVGPDEGES
jgi:WD40 repeat protein